MKRRPEPINGGLLWGAAATDLYVGQRRFAAKRAAQSAVSSAQAASTQRWTLSGPDRLPDSGLSFMPHRSRAAPGPSCRPEREANAEHAPESSALASACLGSAASDLMLYELRFLGPRARVAHLNKADMPDDVRALQIARNLRPHHHIGIYSGDKQIGLVEAQPRQAAR